MGLPVDFLALLVFVPIQIWAHIPRAWVCAMSIRSSGHLRTHENPCTALVRSSGPNGILEWERLNQSVLYGLLCVRKFDPSYGLEAS